MRSKSSAQTAASLAGGSNEISSKLGLPPACGFVGMECGQQVENTCSREKPRSIIAISMRDVRPADLDIFRQPIEATCSEIGEISKRRERVSAFRSEQISSHPCPNNHQHSYNHEKSQRAAPHLLQRVSEPRHHPACHADGDSAGLARPIRRRTCCGLGFVCHRQVAYASSGKSSCCTAPVTRASFSPI